MPLAQKIRDDEFHDMNHQLDPKTRDRIMAAQMRDVEYRLRGFLSEGGFSAEEVREIVAAVRSLLTEGQPVTAERLLPRLRSSGFEDAEQISKALATG
jgi:hypothetical protein